MPYLNKVYGERLCRKTVIILIYKAFIAFDVIDFSNLTPVLPSLSTV